jgi:hypothetical protein
MWVSPLGVVPKSTPGAYRIIHDLSFPEGVSVNDGIQDSDATCTYGSIDTFIDRIWSLGTGTLMGKLDIKQAYKHVPVHAADHLLLGCVVPFQGGAALLLRHRLTIRSEDIRQDLRRCH